MVASRHLVNSDNCIVFRQEVGATPGKPTITLSVLKVNET